MSIKSKVVIEGQKFYDEHLKAILEPEHIGGFVSIAPETGQYFLGKTDGEAIHNGQIALPDKILLLIRIGFPYVHKMGFRGSLNQNR